MRVDEPPGHIFAIWIFGDVGEGHQNTNLKHRNYAIFRTSFSRLEKSQDDFLGRRRLGGSISANFLEQLYVVHHGIHDGSTRHRA